MVEAPYTIRIFVADGDPDGVRIISRMNWTGQGIVFPREHWPRVRTREEMNRPGVYILVGPDPNEDLPRLYVGQSDAVNERIDLHKNNKDFWSWGIAFISTNDGLNKAHIQWLEADLVARAKECDRSVLENDVSPPGARLTESEKADTIGFLNEIMKILPLVGLRAFEKPKSIPISPKADISSSKQSAQITQNKDTIIVPADVDGAKKVFLGENCWHAVKISGGMLDKLQWIACYQTSPVSAITHIARIHHFEPFDPSGKYKVVFSEPAQAIGPIPFGDAPGGCMQGPRYANYNKVKTAKKLSDIVGKGEAEPRQN